MPDLPGVRDMKVELKGVLFFVALFLAFSYAKNSRLEKCPIRNQSWKNSGQSY